MSSHTSANRESRIDAIIPLVGAGVAFAAFLFVLVLGGQPRKNVARVLG